MADQPPTCPRCGQWDRVQQAHVAYGELSARFANDEADWRTSVFAPLRKPHNTAGRVGGFFLLAGVTVAVLGMAVTNPPLLVVLLAVVGMGSGCLVLLVGSLVYAAQLATWKRATQRWNALYYCARDGGLFHPDDGEFIPFPMLKDYLEK